MQASMVWSTWSFENYGILSFFRADSKFIAQIEGAEITSSVENVDFGTVSANGYEYTRSFNILTLGDDCEYSAIVEGGDGHFSISPGPATSLPVKAPHSRWNSPPRRPATTMP